MQKRNIAVTLECFVKKGNKYLMLHRNSNKKIMPGVWMAPGGHREFNEGLFECAKREIMEETGLSIKNLKVKAIGNAHLKDLDQEIFFTFVFADYKSGKLKNDPNEGELKWLTPKEISKLDNLLAEIKYITPYIFDKKNKIISYKAVYEKGNKLTNFVLEKSR
jgi:8-oxo-dGTP diphosphatase